MTRPTLLDLYCCEGGASMGYHRAGFNVIGVDLFDRYSQRRYPFPSLRTDALAAVEYVKGVDAYHASPPCQKHSAGTRAIPRDDYPDLIGPTREALLATKKPFVLENVVGAPLLGAIELCGCMFDLTAVDDDGVLLHLERTRLFESNVELSAPSEHDHSDHEWVGGCYGGARKDKYEAKFVRHGGYVPPSRKVKQDLMGIDWMTVAGMYQALPPVYTEHIGKQLLAVL